MNEIIIHPGYNEDQAYHDLAIVKVSHVEYSESVKPICIPDTPDPTGKAYIGRSVTVAGWGSYNLSNIASSKLKTASLAVLPSR